MNDPIELGSYLPSSFHSTAEQDYFAFLWDTFEINYNNGKYQFAFLAYHMLAMSFIYFNIWQIKKTRPEDFSKGLIGFAREEKDLLAAPSPFTFSRVSERTVLRFLKLIGCGDSEIGRYAAFVDLRNNTVHTNGNIFFGTQGALDAKIGEILRAVADIQKYSRPVIEQCYREFLLHNHDPEVREYPDASDQIREVLIHSNYMSWKDIETCIRFDIEKLNDRRSFADMRTLHRCLLANYDEAGLDMA